MSAYSLLALRQALAEEAFSGQHPIRILTTGAGSVTAIVIGDLAFGASGATPNEYHGCWLYNTAASPTAPFSSRVLQQAGLNVSNGTLTVAPAFGSAPGSGAEIIFCYDFHPDELVRAINRILRNLAYFAYLPVTLCPDGDMEDSGVSLWNVVSGGTFSKSSTNPFLIGRQVLNVQGAVNAGVASDPISVLAGESLLLSVPVQVDDAGGAIIRLFDVTNNAAIKSVTVTEEQPVTVQFYADAPSGCEQVAVRLLSSQSTSAFDVGPVTLLSQDRKRYALDSIERTHDIKDMFRVPLGKGAVVTDSYYSFPDAFRDVDFMVEEDARAGSPMNVVLPTYPTEPYFMRVQRTFPELATTAATINASTNTTQADRDTVVQGAMHYLERARYARAVAGNPQLAAVHLGRSREYARKFAMMRQQQGYGILARMVPTPRQAVAMS